MAFWNSEKLAEQLADGTIVTPFDSSCISHGAYELSMGPEYFLTSTNPPVKKLLNPEQQLILPPGQFALLLTEETITVPQNAIAFISIKAGIKFRGLINVSGFHVDPGFNGRLKFAVYNAGSRNICLSRGQRLFPIWFADLSDSTKDLYNEENSSLYRGQWGARLGISDEDVMKLEGEVASPSFLLKEIASLKHEWQVTKLVIYGFLSLLTALFVLVVGNYFSK